MTKNKLKFIIAIIALIICIGQIKQTYAKYTESKTGDAEFEVACWHILLNNSDITEGSTMSSLINPVYENNTNVASGVIAPGSEGYFLIDINATNTEVSFSYNISITPAISTDVEDLTISAYQIDNGAMNYVQSGINNLTGNISHNAQNKTISLKIYFEWFEGQGEQMNNAADTAASVGGGTGKINISATFTQIANT
ncbi:MAG: hypothetical protein IKG27_04990 [Bacilli bacterium]|nr:hypothetical protein [Bacilli bacterium]